MCTRGEPACRAGQPGLCQAGVRTPAVPRFNPGAAVLAARPATPIRLWLRGRRVAADRRRALATRHDTLAVRYEAIVCIAAIHDWLCQAFNTPLRAPQAAPKPDR